MIALGSWRGAALLASLTLSIVVAPFSLAATDDTLDRSPSALKAKLEHAEATYNAGNLKDAIDEANALTGLVDSSILRSDTNAREAKADLVIFQLRAGSPHISAQLLRELFISLQLDMPMVPGYDKDPSAVLLSTPELMKEHFAKVSERLHADANTKAIVNSLIENTYPKDYAKQLKDYAKRLDPAMAALQPMKSIAETEELKYTDRIASDASPAMSAEDAPQKSQLVDLGETLKKLSIEARQMPLGDMRPAIGLYQLSLLANSQKFYSEGARFAEDSANHVKALMPNAPIIPDIQISQAFAEQKGYTDQFKSIRDDILKRNKLSP